MTERFYMVKFDLKNSKGREAEYYRADAALKFRFGPSNYWKIVKQCRIVRTDRDASAIRNSLTQTLGGNCNILVVRLRHGHAYTLVDPAARLAAKNCFDQISAP
jgi:hypothetical protein